MELMYPVVIAAVAALLFALVMAVRVLRCDRGEEDIRRISGIIGRAASAFLRRQYAVIAIFFVIVSAALLVMNLCFGKGNIYTPFAFISGGFFSALSGYIGMKIATASNGRTVVAARRSLNGGLRTAFSSGMVMGMSVVGLGLIDISVWYLLLKYAFCQSIEVIAANMLTFGIGASSVALFARVGGGIFTKAADVGADLCGKVEAGIPEDDIRNPAVIADNVGDNVGDVAGMGADLYESYVGSVLSCAALGVFTGYGERGFLLPFLIAAAGIFCSIIGSFFVRTHSLTEQRSLLRALRTGMYITSLLMAIAAEAEISHCLMGNHGYIFRSGKVFKILESTSDRLESLSHKVYNFFLDYWPAHIGIRVLIISFDHLMPVPTFLPRLQIRPDDAQRLQRQHLDSLLFPYPHPPF